MKKQSKSLTCPLETKTLEWRIEEESIKTYPEVAYPDQLKQEVIKEAIKDDDHQQTKDTID
jgi:hypothetical protein